MKHNAELYSDFDPTTREDSGDRTKSWKIPNFTTFDLYASYKMNAGRYPLSLNLSVLNLTDLLYVNEAVDNSKYGGYHRDANGQTKASKDRHTAQDGCSLLWYANENEFRSNSWLLNKSLKSLKKAPFFGAFLLTVIPSSQKPSNLRAI